MVLGDQGNRRWRKELGEHRNQSRKWHPWRCRSPDWLLDLHRRFEESGSSETNDVLRQDTGAHMGTPNDILSGFRKVVHARVKLVRTRMVLLRPRTHKLRLPQHHTTQNKMSYAVLLIVSRTFSQTFEGRIIWREVEAVSVQSIVVPKLIGEAMGDDSRDLVHGGGREPSVPDVGVAAALPLDRLRENLETMEPSLAHGARVRVPVDCEHCRRRSDRRTQARDEPLLDQVVDSVPFEQSNQSGGGAGEGGELGGAGAVILAGDSAFAVGDRRVLIARGRVGDGILVGRLVGEFLKFR